MPTPPRLKFAQRTLAEMVTRMEEEDPRARMELFGTAVEYKHSWSQAIERHEKAGLEPPRPIPHPDDIILDPSNGDVKFDGPETKEQRDRLEEALKRRADAQEEVSYFAEKYRRARSDEQKARWLEEWHWEQRMFDILNDIVPRRYKAELRDRSYARGLRERARPSRNCGEIESCAANMSGEHFAWARVGQQKYAKAGMRQAPLIGIKGSEPSQAG